MHYHQIGGVSLLMTHNLPLVALSWIISVFAAYTALTTLLALGGSGAHANRKFWLLAGAVSYGFGVWAMHFTGMTAMEIGPIVRYNVPITLFSVLPALLGAYAAFSIASRPGRSFLKALGSGFCLGAGIGAMHYAGMLAVRTGAALSFNWVMVGVSVLVAVVIGAFGMWALMNLAAPGATGRNLFVAALAGSAIPFMHYTAMSATVFSDIAATAGSQAGVFSLNGILVVAIVFMSVPLFLASLVGAGDEPQVLEAA